jgi:hypothetical protein
VSREQKVSVVDASLNCFLTKDLSKVRFADDVTFVGPRMPKLVGKQNVSLAARFCSLYVTNFPKKLSYFIHHGLCTFWERTSIA